MTLRKANMPYRFTLQTWRKRNSAKESEIENHFNNLIVDIYSSMENKEKIKKLKTEIEFFEVQGYPVEKYKEIYEDIITEYSY